MHKVRCLGLLALAVCITACSDSAPAEPAVVERVRSVQSITVLDEAGQEQTLLIAGVRGPDPNMAAEAAAEARAALDDVLSRGSITHTPTGDPDRHARIPSAMAVHNGDDLAETLVEAGWLMVWPRLGQGADYVALYAAEKSARQAQTGAWGQGVFAVRDTDPNRLAPFLDSAQIIEGRVISTGSARDGRVFINFGLDWRTDFTAVADEDAAERFAEAGLPLQSLEGTVIRVRGWMYELNGPSIMLSHPAQIELVDAPPQPRLPR